MRVIIAGSRNIALHPRWFGHLVAQSGFTIDEIVSGHSGNIDMRGESWASALNLPIRRFPANWEAHGRKAGPLRNSEMAAYADALIYFWDGKSRGTADMVKKMKTLNKPTFDAMALIVKKD